MDVTAMDMTEPHLLVVDDNAANVELMLDLLDDHGFEDVIGINDPCQVMPHCLIRLPDLILLDIRMPIMDGYAVIEQLQSLLGDKAPPIIVLTAQIDDETRHRALKMGVRDFLTKPLKHDEVLQRIRNTLNVEQRFRQRDEEAVTLAQVVTERTRELDRQSRTDPVTQLPNRRGLIQQIEQAPRAGYLGLLFIALDGLDDTIRLHGYRVTESLMQQLGARLSLALAEHAQQRPTEAPTLGLWGGSEFLVVAPCSALAELDELAEQVLGHFEHDQALDDLLLPIKARIGISWHVDEAQTACDAERLVHQAALALPQQAENAIQRYSEPLAEQRLERLRLQQALRDAHLRGEMWLAFQPKLCMRTHRIIGAEALLRWDHPTLGSVSPGLFIPLAEASGDILAIGEWVIDEALAHIQRWRAQGLLGDDFHIAVNVAARQLARRTFAEDLLARLSQRNIPPRYLALEVTESGLMGDMKNAIQQLTLLSETCIAVAIDDFGTGHSSLAYLKTLPFSTLKIDRFFVKDLEENDIDRQLARTIVQLAHSVGRDVVAEGIETDAQANYLRSIGCEMAQGFLYARPLPADAFTQWCETWTPSDHLSTPETP
ncbi:EAL domain-containing response regulator [Halomonas dongshanensis]|uniref:EAL domain-containing protein n=1 Tax=Halomonas dongshanensis TaxID=2890835 RepID=A0ABT2EDV6_9GAMM|nr:EAL domain-containing protein [Halomonas dongshanensis]MCS2609735.1 EAL domain-containing protein [Halomonas dongshanensis]